MTSRDEVWSGSQTDDYPNDVYDPNQPPRTEYGEVTGRSGPRSFRAALRVSF